MEYFKFHEWELSRLGLGCMRLPTQGERGPVDEEKAVELIRYAYEHGINYFDTAYRYHEGESELVTGKALSIYPRESYHLVSKFPGHMLVKNEDGRLAFTGFPGRKVYFASPAEVFETQLEKCGVDYFDIYHLHNVNENSVKFYSDESVGVVDYLVSQKKAGRIRHLGFTAHGSADIIGSFLDRYPGVFEAVQIQINYLDWTLQDAESKYRVITEHGIPVISMESIRGGALARLPEKGAEILRAADPATSQAAWALRWLMTLPNLKLVLSGMSTLDQLKENLDVFNNPKPLNEEEKRVVESVVNSLVDRVPCTACRYCTEGCPMGLNIPGLISMYNEAQFGGNFTIAMAVRGMKEEDLPSACVGCGACAAVCPQGIDIPAVMQKAAKYLHK